MDRWINQTCISTKKSWAKVRRAVRSSAYVTVGVLTESLDADSFIRAVDRLTQFRRRMMIRDLFQILKRYRTLLNISNQISVEIELDKAISAIVDTTSTVMDCERVSLYLMIPSMRELECKYSQDCIGARVPLGEGIVGQCAQQGKIINVTDVSALNDQVGMCVVLGGVGIDRYICMYGQVQCMMVYCVGMYGICVVCSVCMCVHMWL